MKRTRRSFLVAAASMALVPVISIPAIAKECPRQKAFRLADRATRESQVGDSRSIDTITELLEHLPTIPGPNKSFDKTIDEISVVLRGITKDGERLEVDIMTCTNEAFSVSIVRDLLKYRKVLVACSPKWSLFSNRYGEFIVMA